MLKTIPRFLISSLLASVFSLATLAHSFAAEEAPIQFDKLNGFIALPLGLAVMSGKLGFSFGAQVGAIFESGMRGSLLFQYYGNTQDVQQTTGLVSQTDSFVNVGTEFALFATRMGWDLQGLAFGFKVGFGAYSRTNTLGNVSTTEDSSTSTFFAPEITYDKRLSGGLSLGGEFDYVLRSGKSAFLFLVPFKIWF